MPAFGKIAIEVIEVIGKLIDSLPDTASRTQAKKFFRRHPGRISELPFLMNVRFFSWTFAELINPMSDHGTSLGSPCFFF